MQCPHRVYSHSALLPTKEEPVKQIHTTAVISIAASRQTAIPAHTEVHIEVRESWIEGLILVVVPRLIRLSKWERVQEI